jgi:hypothetical protein
MPNHNREYKEMCQCFVQSSTGANRRIIEAVRSLRQNGKTSGNENGAKQPLFLTFVSESALFISTAVSMAPLGGGGGV